MRLTHVRDDAAKFRFASPYPLLGFGFFETGSRGFRAVRISFLQFSTKKEKEVRLETFVTRDEPPETLKTGDELTEKLVTRDEPREKLVTSEELPETLLGRDAPIETLVNRQEPPETL
ncbi:hypothetical protein Btru_076251 [Bulinus truncatus]|nr:hypothetical protein Btru_076251 [Bulinus truncatus]